MKEVIERAEMTEPPELVEVPVRRVTVSRLSVSDAPARNRRERARKCVTLRA